MSKADLVAKLKNNGYDTSKLDAPVAAPVAPPADVPESMLSRVANAPLELAKMQGRALMAAPGSALKFAEGIKEAVTNPVQTAQSLGLGIAGGARNAAQAALPKQAFDFLTSFENDPEAINKAIEVANAIGGDYKTAYGSPEAIKLTFETDPVRMAGDLSMLLSGAGPAARVAGMSRTGAGLTQAATLIDPVMLGVRGGAAVGRGIANVAAPFVNPRAVAGNALLGSVDDSATVLNALAASQGARATPGYVPTFSERLVGEGVYEPGAAGLEAGLNTTNNPVGRKVFAQRQQSLNALNDQLARIENQLSQRATAATPQGLQDLTEVRNQLLRRISEEQAVLTQQGVDLADILPNTGQREPGQALITRAGELEKGVRTNVINPAYADAYAKAGSTPIDIADAAAAAEKILGRKLSDFDPSTAPRTVQLLSELAPTTTVKGKFGITKTTGGNVTLQQIDDIRKAINADIGEAMSASGAGTVDIRLRNLKQLNAVLDEAIAKSGLTDEAKTAYTGAVSKFRDEFVPQFKTGIPADLRRTTWRNEPSILPDAVVQKFLGSERGAEQFTNLFKGGGGGSNLSMTLGTGVKGDVKAAQAMASGVLDLFRSKVIDKTTGAVNSAQADAFIKQYGDNLDVLQQAGVNIRGAINDVRNQAAKLEGKAGELGDLQGALKAPENAAELVDAALKSPKLMGNTISRLDKAGRAAFGGELTNRVLDMVKAGKHEEALKFLTENADALRTGMGRKGAYDDLVDMANSGRDLAAVVKDAPKTITPSTARDLSAFSDAELTDLAMVAEDIRRGAAVENMAATGSRPGPAYKAGSEAASDVGVAAGDAPALTNRVYSVLRNIGKRFEKRINRKAAAELAYVMYTNPDAAAALINEAIARKSRAAKPARDLRGVTAVGAATNAMAPENQNAMAE
jgi:hypothetical protein